MQITFIHNPGAGDGDADVSRLRAVIEAAGHSVHQVRSDAFELDAQLARGADLIVVSGGDGTIGRVAKRMAGRDIPLAALAAGTANNIALTLGIESLTPEQQIGSWPTGRRAKVDIAIATAPWGSERLIEGLGAGLFASSIEIADKSLDSQRELQSRQRLAYALQILKERLGAFPATHIGATLDGRDISGDYIVFEVMNTRFVGPNLFLAPDANPGDGLLDVILVTAGERDLLGTYLSTWQRGALDAPRLRSERGRELHLQWTGFDLHLDDLVWPPDGVVRPSGTLPIEIRVADRGVEFLVP